MGILTVSINYKVLVTQTSFDKIKALYCPNPYRRGCSNAEPQLRLNVELRADVHLVVNINGDDNFYWVYLEVIAKLNKRVGFLAKLH
jgi:hypothetical protein